MRERDMLDRPTTSAGDTSDREGTDSTFVGFAGWRLRAGAAGFCGAVCSGPTAGLSLRTGAVRELF
ncbi:camphor resistance protein crcb [Roseibium sp. TrichSKD4]|nr:camphor resistance protein crcb [Roseibium sp. TrichSKD4]